MGFIKCTNTPDIREYWIVLLIVINLRHSAVHTTLDWFQHEMSAIHEIFYANFIIEFSLTFMIYQFNEFENELKCDFNSEQQAKQKQIKKQTKN